VGRQRRLGGRARRVVAQREHGAHARAGRVEQGARAPHGQHLRAVRTADAPRRLGDRLAAQHRPGERELRRRVRGAVDGAQAVRRGVLVDRHVEPRDAVDALGRRVHEGDPPLGVGDDDPLGELPEHRRPLGEHPA
jgi:hypothetical protein